MSAATSAPGIAPPGPLGRQAGDRRRRGPRREAPGAAAAREARGPQGSPAAQISAGPADLAPPTPTALSGLGEGPRGAAAGRRQEGGSPSRAGLASAGPSHARTQGGSRNGVTGTDRGRRGATCARRRQNGAATMGAVAPQDPPGHRTPEMGSHRIHRGPAPEASSRGALPRTASELRSLHSTNAKERVMHSKEENRGSEKLQMELA